MGTIGGIPVQVPVAQTQPPSAPSQPIQIPMANLNPLAVSQQNIRNITVNAQSRILYTQPQPNPIVGTTNIRGAPQVVQTQTRPTVIAGNVRPAFG